MERRNTVSLPCEKFHPLALYRLLPHHCHYSASFSDQHSCAVVCIQKQIK